MGGNPNLGIQQIYIRHMAVMVWFQFLIFTIHTPLRAYMEYWFTCTLNDFMYNNRIISLYIDHMNSFIELFSAQKVTACVLILWGRWQSCWLFPVTHQENWGNRWPRTFLWIPRIGVIRPCIHRLFPCGVVTKSNLDHSVDGGIVVVVRSRSPSSDLVTTPHGTREQFTDTGPNATVLWINRALLTNAKSESSEKWN